jgi:hypothetical protein
MLFSCTKNLLFFQKTRKCLSDPKLLNGSICIYIIPAVTVSSIGRHTIGPALSGLGEGLAEEAWLGSLRSSDSLGRVPAGWLRSSVERCFLRHISAAGFRVKRAGVKKRSLACHVSEGAWIDLCLPSPLGSCSDETRSKLGRKIIQNRVRSNLMYSEIKVLGQWQFCYGSVLQHFGFEMMKWQWKCRATDLIWGDFHPYRVNRLEITALFVHSPLILRDQMYWDKFTCVIYHDYRQYWMNIE